MDNSNNENNQMNNGESAPTTNKFVNPDANASKITSTPPINTTPNTTPPVQNNYNTTSLPPINSDINNNTNNYSTIDETPSDPFKLEKKSKSGLIIVAIVVLLIVGAGVYLFFGTSSEKIVNKAIGGLYKNIEKIYNNVMTTDAYTSINSKGKISISTTAEEIKTLNGLSFNYDLGYEKDTNKLKLDVSLNDKEELLSVLYFLKDKISYFNIKGTKTGLVKADTTEYIDQLEEVINTESNNDDYLYIVKVAIESIKKNITKENLKKQTVFNEYKLMSIKTTYTIDDKEIEKLSLGIINDIKNDTKAVEALTRLLKYETVEKTKEYLDEEAKYITYDDSDVYGGYDFGIEEEPTNITIIGYSNPLTGEINKLSIVNTVSLLECVNENDVYTCDYSVSSSNEEKIKSKFVYDTKKGTASFTFNFDNVSINIDAKTSVKNNITESNVTMKVSIDDESITITSDSTSEINKKIDDIDVSKAKDVTSLTEEEYLEIETKVTESISKITDPIWTAVQGSIVQQTCNIYGTNYEAVKKKNQSTNEEQWNCCSKTNANECINVSE